MPRIFISYRRSDSSTISGRIYDHLILVFGDDSVFKDVYDIPAGSDFRKVIEENINACNVQLIVIGPGWVDVRSASNTRRLDDLNDAVRIEVETGLNCKDILVIPVLVGGAAMPTPEQLPEVLHDLAFRNAVVIRDDPDFRTDIGKLINSLKGGQIRRARRMRRLFSIAFATVVFAAVIVTAAVLITRTAVQDRADANRTATTVALAGLADATLTQAANAPTLASTELISTATVPATSSVLVDVTATALTPDPSGALELIKEGEEFAQQTDYNNAIDRYTKAIALDPGSALAYIDRADAYGSIGSNYDLAIADAQQSIKLDSNLVSSYNKLGELYFSAEQYDLSVQTYTQALSLSENASSYLGRGIAYHVLTDFPHALEDLTKAIELDPNNVDAYQERAQTNFDAKQYADAIRDFSVVIEQNPQSSNAYIGRGQSYRETGDIPHALADFTQALVLDPQSATAYYERGVAHQQNGDTTEARDDYEKALNINPDLTSAYIGLARLNLDSFNDPTTALGQAIRAVDLEETNSLAQAVLGDVYYALGNKPDALTHYLRYQQLMGADADPAVIARIHELDGS